MVPRPGGEGRRRHSTREADPQNSHSAYRRVPVSRVHERPASYATLSGISTEPLSTRLSCFAILFFVILVACQDPSGGTIVAPNERQFTVAAEGDSDLAQCAIFNCRTITYEEKSELEAELNNAFYIYMGDGRYECASLVLNSMNTVNHMTYVGTVPVWDWDESGNFGRVIGVSVPPHGSQYLDLDYMRQLGSINGILKTLIHEEYHLEDPHLIPTKTPGYLAEPPAKRAENDCTI